MKTMNVKAGKTIARPIGNRPVNCSNLFIRCSFWTAFAAFGLLLGFFPSKSIGQNLVSTNLSKFYHQVGAASFSGDTMKVQFILGNNAQLAQKVAGYEVNISFPALQSSPSQVYASVKDAWVAQGAASSPNSNFNASTATLRLDYLRDDHAGQNGQGTVAEICLIRSGGFTSSEAIAAMDGIVMVDNVDSKWGYNMLQVDPALSVNAYPNPAHATLTVRLSNPTNSTIRILNVDGMEILSQLGSAMQVIDISNLAPGGYVLCVNSGSFRHHQKLIVF